MGVTSNYKAPKATVDPDTSKSWLRRAYPIVASHKAALPHRAHPVLRRPGAAGADPGSAQSRHRQLARPLHTVPLHFYVDWVVVARARRRRDGLHLPHVALQGGLRHRVRPAQRHLRAPDPHVVPVLRPGAVRAADFAGQLGHPLGADVPHLRPDDSGAVLHRRRGLRLHAVHQRAAGPRGHGHHAVHLLDGRADAQGPLPGVVADPVPAGRSGHRGRRERQRRAGGQVVRRRGAATPTDWRRRPTRCSGATSRTPTCGPASPR